MVDFDTNNEIIKKILDIRKLFYEGKLCIDGDIFNKDSWSLLPHDISDISIKDILFLTKKDIEYLHNHTIIFFNQEEYFYKQKKTTFIEIPYWLYSYFEIDMMKNKISELSDNVFGKGLFVKLFNNDEVIPLNNISIKEYDEYNDKIIKWFYFRLKNDFQIWLNQQPDSS